MASSTAASLVSAAARADATKALDSAATASPSAKLFAPSGLYDDPFVSGLSAGAQQRLVVSSPGFLPKDLTPAGKTFVSDFNSAYGHQPVPQAIFGYEAMSALLAVLDQAGAQADNRAVGGSRFPRPQEPQLGDRDLLDQWWRSEHRPVHLRPGQGWSAGAVQVCPVARVIARSGARVAIVLAAVIGAATLGGCGSDAAAKNKIRGGRLTIYVSVPLNGASAVSGRSVLDGAELALDSIHARIGGYRITLRPLDDALAKTGTWDPGQTTVDVHAAMLDPTLIGYLGDFNSGASAVSIPLLNRADVPQISPTSTAVGLTSGGPEASPGEPDKYYPTGRRTFARVVPSDAVQAAVQAKLQRSMGCTKTYVLDDDEFDGRDIAQSFEVAAKAAGLDVVGSQEYEPKATSYASLAAGIAQTGADCVLLGAVTQNSAPLVTRQIAAALPHALIFGSAELAESTYVDPVLGGIPLALDPRVLLTSPTLSPASYPPAGRKFYALYARRYGTPQPAAIFGYEAMSLMLDAISRATDGGEGAAVRSKVLTALFSTRDRHSVLGTYSLDPNGDTSLNEYGVYRVVNGRLSFWKAVRG